MLASLKQLAVGPTEKIPGSWRLSELAAEDPMHECDLPKGQHHRQMRSAARLRGGSWLPGSFRRTRSATIRRLTALTALALALSAFFPAPAHAEIVDLGLKCVGREVVRCGYMHYDTANDVLRGYATATDTGGSTDWDVAVNDLRLQRSPTGASGTWTTVAQNGDYDGYQPTDDFANTALVPCIDNYYYRVVYHWSARTGSTTASGDEASDRAVAC